MFYTFVQNNSGGYFIKDENVEEVVIIEAETVSDAHEIFDEISEDYQEYCECCGTRWSSFPEETETPQIFGDAPEDSSWYSIIYYADGDKKIVKVR